VPHAISTSSTAAAAATAAGAPAAEAKARYNSEVTDNMARWFQSVTPEDVAAMEGYTVESIASRWHPGHGSNHTRAEIPTALEKLEPNACMPACVGACVCELTQ
jgi:hypothetical protein